MKKVIGLFILFLSISGYSQLKLNSWIEKYNDEYDHSFYPIINGDLNYTFKNKFSIEFTFWSNIDSYIYPYVNIIFNWQKWSASINPLKPDIYNYTVQISFYETISILHRRKCLVDRFP